LKCASGIAESIAIPWELLRDPETGTWLALNAQAFVRGLPSGRRRPSVPVRAKASSARVLLVICRPRAAADVPFRSLARYMVSRLGRDVALALDVLRPPTYEKLTETLQTAKQNGIPYDIVHFDGHGTFDDPDSLGITGRVISGRLPGSGSGGSRHGFIIFEAPPGPDGQIFTSSGGRGKPVFVDGFALGSLLRETSVPVLVLNACQSAFAEAPAEPATLEAGSSMREEVEAYGSFAQAVLDAGDAAGVVAMRYAVYVPTAERFVAELYTALADGRTLGEAVSQSRKHLTVNAERKIGFKAMPLRDWPVPVVWEDAPLRLWPEAAAARRPFLRSEAGAAADDRTVPASHDDNLPRVPETGFVGRDETLYALDRAFDNENRLVLLHGCAGAGKTAAAADFARWYTTTGGIDGPVLFDTFEQYWPLARVLDRIGEAFPFACASDGKPWKALTDKTENQAERRRSALLQLNQTPVLWVWDSVERVAGLPAGSPSDWSMEEQLELRDFLEDARMTKARFLLTSRRDEWAWLGELVSERVRIPPMLMRERLELAAAIAERHGGKATELPDLRPLLHFTAGNPLMILAAVGQALDDGIACKEKLESFVARLRAGEQESRARRRGWRHGKGVSARHSPMASEEPSTSASSDSLSLLYLFQGFVEAELLHRIPVHAKYISWQRDGKSAPQNSPFDRTREIMGGPLEEDPVRVLDRAVEVGLLTAEGREHNFEPFWRPDISSALMKALREPLYKFLPKPAQYSIHPALPWFFRDMFEHFYSAENRNDLRHAFVKVMGDVGASYAEQYQAGRITILKALLAEGDNLRTALALVESNNWWDEDDVRGILPGLHTLYQATRRRDKMRELTRNAAQHFVDPTTGGPKRGSTAHWLQIIGYLRQQAQDEGNFSELARWTELVEKWARQGKKLGPLYTDREMLIERGKAIENVAIRRVLSGDKKCIDDFMEALELFKSGKAPQDEAICLCNLGRAYYKVEGLGETLGDLDAADNCFQRSYDLRTEDDRLGKAKCLVGRGTIALRREKRTQLPHERRRYHKNAEDFFIQALDLIAGLPLDTEHETAWDVHGGLACVYIDEVEVGNLRAPDVLCTTSVKRSIVPRWRAIMLAPAQAAS
jgi:hypothetical protein